MEQAVQVFFAIIAIGIAIGAIVSIYDYSREDVRMGSLSNSLGVMRYKCDAACASVPGSSTGANVDVPSGTILYTSGKKICSSFVDKKGNKNVKCEICGCDLVEKPESSPVLDLSSELAQQVIDSYNYFCEFEKKDDSTVDMGCSG